MKKFLLTLMGVICSLGMWADTETPGNTGTSNSTYNGTSFSIAGKYIAGAGGTKVGDMKTKGMKIRSNQNNALVLSVNEGYRIDALTIYGVTNDKSTAVNVTSATVDGGKNLLSSDIQLPVNTSTTCGTISLSSISAKDSITIGFASGSSKQVLLDIHVTYTQTAVVTKTISSVKLNGTAITDAQLASLKSNKTLTIDGSSLNGCGVLDVALSSGSSNVERTIEGSTATYSFSIANNPVEDYTVTVNNISKTYTKSGNVLAYKEDDTEATGAGDKVVTLNGITATYSSKLFGYGDASVTLGSTKYQPLKLSTGEAFNITFPEGYKATKVTVYGWSANGNGKLSAFKETESSTDKVVNVTNDVYYATASAADIYPSVYTYELDNWASVYATGGGSASQPYVVMDFTLVADKTASDLAVASATASVNKNETTTVGFTTTSTGEVTVKSDKENVATATVNGSNIEITGVGAGEATITVSQAEDDTYAAGEKTITVTVTDPNAPTVVYNWNTVGTTTVAGTVTQNETVKIKNVSTSGIKFANGLSYQNYLKIESSNEGFKAGDIITWTGCLSNSKTDRQGGIMITPDTISGTDPFLACSEKFNNTYDATVEATTGSFTLTADADVLYIGRAITGLKNATATWLTQLTVSRPITVASPTINADGYGTFSSDKNVQITGAKVYKAQLDVTENKITCTEIESGKVPAGTGVLLYKEGATEASTATALFVDAADAIEDNDLKATTLADGTTADVESSLALSGSVFKSFTGSAFVAGKAYFPYTSGGGESKTFTIVFADAETTAVNAIETVNSNNGAAYNLAGQRVNANSKGIVIMNGKKFINK